MAKTVRGGVGGVKGWRGRRARFFGTWRTRAGRGSGAAAGVAEPRQPGSRCRPAVLASIRGIVSNTDQAWFEHISALAQPHGGRLDETWPSRDALAWHGERVFLAD
jgi:hypothetical protein